MTKNRKARQTNRLMESFTRKAMLCPDTDKGFLVTGNGPTPRGVVAYRVLSELAPSFENGVVPDAAVVLALDLESVSISEFETQLGSLLWNGSVRRTG